MTVDGFGRKLKVFDDVSGKIEEFFFEESMDSRMINAFIEAIENNQASPVSGEDGLYTVKITEAAYQSATSKKLMTIKEKEQVNDIIKRNERLDITSRFND